MNKFIIDYLYDVALKTMKKKFGSQKHTKKELRVIKDAIKEKINRKKNYISITVENNEVKKLIVATIEKCQIYTQNITVIYYALDEDYAAKSEVKKDLMAVQKKLGTSLHMSINCSSKKVKLIRSLKGLGFKLLGNQLIGNVTDGLSYLNKKKKLLENFEIEPMVYRRDAEECIKLDKYTHKHTKNNGIYISNPAYLKDIRKFLRKVCSANTAWIVRYKGRIVGHIASISALTPIPWVVWIAVHPKHQGKGLGNSLYLEMLKGLKKSGFKKYGGFSKSPYVLSKSKKMKRSITSSTYTFKGKIK